MAEYKGVLVCGELIDGKVASITTELLGCARSLADQLKEEVSCLLASEKVGEAAKEAIAFGADKVYTAEDPALKDYQADCYMQVLEPLVKDISPRIILVGHTPMGSDLAPRLAFRLGVGLAMDRINLSIDPNTKLLLEGGPVYGGNAQATFTSDLLPQIVTVRVKAMSPMQRSDSRKGEIIPLKVKIDPAKVRTKILETVKQEVTGVKLEDATVIVSGGRGMGGPEPYKTVLQQLADTFTKGGVPAAVGASRPPCDSGWVPESYHIGLTGKIVAPEVYLAIGISGASQHVAGMSGSKNIVAINKDPEANMFKVANYGVVGKWEDVLPAFTQKVKELLSS